MTAAVTPLEALRRCVAVLKQVDYADCGESEALWCQHAIALSEAEAVLRVAAAPVSEIHSELTVWYGSMSESNGKSNFTATLMRKGATAFDTNQFTFARSEYPDRVRYDADCMRYLIGEIDTQPCILDYDADKHSGYAAPVVPVAAQPVVPVPEAVLKRTDEIRLTMANPTGIGRATLIGYVECLLAHIALTNAAPHIEAQPAGEVIPVDKLCALLPGPYYMDQPDGGSVSVLEQVERMSKDAARYRWLYGSSAKQFVHPIVMEQLRNPLWDTIQYIGPLTGGALDQAIDKAIAMAQGDKHGN